MKPKQTIINYLDEHTPEFIEIADQIWEYAEIAWQEFKSSKLQADYLAAQGFSITWDIGGINTAFIAEWGGGKPELGFIGEYDALPGLSQKNQPNPEPITAGAPGHGCGHNLLGTGCLAAALSVKQFLIDHRLPGTVRYYGCPAEEGGGGKTFMARAGAFSNLDAAFNFHPSSINFPSKGSNLSVNHLKFRFHGRAAHAGGAPHLGRSALDAVELMNVGVNYLREHVTDTVRIHYIITNGGSAPNIVPAEAEVYYYIRAHMPDELESVTERVRNIAQGAALMTDTRVQEIFESATTCIINNHYLADLHYDAMQDLGPIEYTADEIDYALKINLNFPVQNAKYLFDHLKTPPEYQSLAEQYRNQPLIGGNFPALDENEINTGSTDVGDVSWLTPLSLLRTTCWTTGTAAHSWGVAAASRSSIGHKGMLHAARIMALTAAELLEYPHHLESIRAEFNQNTAINPYHCPIPDDVKPPQYPNPERGVH